MKDLRQRILYNQAKRELKQQINSLDRKDIQRGEVKSATKPTNDTYRKTDAKNRTKSRIEDRKREERTTQYAYDWRVPDDWRPISYTEWRQSELRKKEKEEKYKASTLAQRQNTSWENVERKKRHQDKKVKSSTNTETPTRNAIKCGLKDGKKTTSRAPSVEIVGKSDNTNDRVSNRPKSPSVECIGVVPPRYNNRQSITTKTTMQLTVHKEYRCYQA